MKISILTPDVSQNCLGRAYLLARLLQRRYEVEIIGPSFEGAIWEPLAGQDRVSVRTVPGRSLLHEMLPHLRAMRKAITGDVVYASKPLLTSYGVGLLDRFLDNRPLVLDIDDWQMGFRIQALQELPPHKALKSLAESLVHLGVPGSYWNTLLSDRLISLADAITVSNSFLREKFGGAIIWHARDTQMLDPAKVSRREARKRIRVSDQEKVVMFLGTPRPYKGLDDLIESMTFLNDNRFLLLLVGLDDSQDSATLKNMVRENLPIERVRLFGPQPFRTVPSFLSAADIVVVPQKKNCATVGQVPAKVFDAMAMAKPIVATRVSDLPIILEDCGRIVEPGQPEELATAIKHLSDNLEEAERLGTRARDNCIKRYSWDAMEPVLNRVFDRFR